MAYRSLHLLIGVISLVHPEIILLRNNVVAPACNFPVFVRKKKLIFALIKFIILFSLNRCLFVDYKELIFRIELLHLLIGGIVLYQYYQLFIFIGFLY